MAHSTFEIIHLSKRNLDVYVSYFPCLIEVGEKNLKIVS